MILSILPFVLLLLSSTAIQATPIPHHQSSEHIQSPPAQSAPSSQPKDLISSILGSILNLGTSLVHADSVGGGWNNHLSKYKIREEDTTAINEETTGDLSAALDALRTTIMSFGAVAGGAFANRLSRYRPRADDSESAEHLRRSVEECDGLTLEGLD